ncbi:hypothetical protein RHGRI_017159 [Rhododendron griersonianum]|uniref:Uncharacterized protein n=1 Tax=Rhododendron griersonianum TaxID=479676 RepID=A0AAV6JWR2_9ERIC|nr:hypothetical protein RHGRI_017159 [Rhododendron griersonianum]
MEQATIIPGTPPDGSEVILNVGSLIRRVDPTLYMEADEGDDYIHLPCRIMGCLAMAAIVLLTHSMKNTEGLFHKSLIAMAQLSLKEDPDVELGDTRSVAEALARSKQVELTNGASDGMVNQERLERISQLAEIEDLQASCDLPLAPLFIKDPLEYFHSQQANAIKTLGDILAGTRQNKCSLSTNEAYGSLRDRISEVFDGLTQNIKSTKYQLEKNPQESVLDSLPKIIEEELLHKASADGSQSKMLFLCLKKVFLNQLP